MANTLNIQAVGISGCQDRPGRVSVAICGVPTGIAAESSFTQIEAVLVSRTAIRAGHRCVRRIDKNDASTSAYSVSHQFILGLPDRCIGSLPGHRGLGQELRLEVFNGDQIMGSNDFASPLSRIVLALSGNFQNYSLIREIQS